MGFFWWIIQKWMFVGYAVKLLWLLIKFMIGLYEVKSQACKKTAVLCFYAGLDHIYIYIYIYYWNNLNRTKKHIKQQSFMPECLLILKRVAESHPEQLFHHAGTTHSTTHHVRPPARILSRATKRLSSSHHTLQSINVARKLI